MGRKKVINLVIVLGLILIGILIQIYSDFLWGNRQDNEEKEEVISIWTIHGDIENALAIALDEYKKKHPSVNFEVTVYKNEVYQTAINNALLTDSLPDMFFMWGYSKLQRFIDAGVVQEITDLVENETISQQVMDGGLDAFTYKGKIYALPLYGWKAVVFCNREIFNRYNLKYPQNYNEFLQVMKEFKNKEVVPIISGAKEGWLSSLYYMSLVQGEGPGDKIYEAANEQSIFMEDQFVEAAKKMEHLSMGEYWEKNNLDYDAYNAVHMFSQGEAAMLYYGSWGSTFMDSESSRVRGKIDVIPFPNGNKEEGIGGYVDTFIINKYGAISQSEERMKMYMEITSIVSDIAVNEMGTGLPVYKDQLIDISKFPILYKCFTDSGNQKLYPAYDQIMSEDLSGEYYRILNELVSGERSYQKFISGLALFGE